MAASSERRPVFGSGRASPSTASSSVRKGHGERTKSNELPGRSASLNLNVSPPRVGASKSSGGLRSPQSARDRVSAKAMRPVSFSSSKASNPSARAHARFDWRLGVQIILRCRGVCFAYAMPINEAAVNDPAVPRDQESDVGPPSVARSLNAQSPHRRVRRRADFAEEMRPPSAGVECRLYFPVEPSDVVLLRGQQERFSKVLIPGAQNLARDPGVCRLADGEHAGRLAAKQHEEEANRRRGVPSMVGRRRSLCTSVRSLFDRSGPLSAISVAAKFVAGVRTGPAGRDGPNEHGECHGRA